MKRDQLPNAARAAEPRLRAVSTSGIEVPTQVDASAVDASRIGKPGEYPFTRGIFEEFLLFYSGARARIDGAKIMPREATEEKD